MKPPRRSNVLEIKPPFGGIVTSQARQNQPPGTCVDSENFWPINSSTKRQAFVQAPDYTTETSPDGVQPVVLLERINGVRAGFPQRSMIVAQRDGAPGSANLYVWDGSAWQAATGAEASNIGDGDNDAVLGKAFLNKVYIANGGAAPQVFDYSDGTCVVLVASAGTIPLGMRFFEVWQGALWGAGQVTVDSGTPSPNVLFASRVGDATDWDVTVPASDTGGAFFTAGEDEGLLRGPIQALIPHTNSTMYVCTAEGIAAMYGHPRSGGLFLDYSDYIVLGPMAWCKGPDDTTYAMTTYGLVALPVEEGAPPIPLSYPKLPNEFKWDIDDVTDPKIMLSYDRAYNCIHIRHAGPGVLKEAWYYDLNLGGFFKANTEVLNTVAIEHPPIDIGTGSEVLVGTLLFGLVRYGGEGSVSLSTTGRSSSITFAPVKIATSLFQKSRIVSAKVLISDATTDRSGSDSILTMAVASTMEKAESTLDAGNAQFTRDFGTTGGSGGFSGIVYPRISGSALSLKLEFPGDPGSPLGTITNPGSPDVLSAPAWNFEGIELNLQPAGLNRGP